MSWVLAGALLLLVLLVAGSRRYFREQRQRRDMKHITGVRPWWEQQ
jgi:hypothetical protein